MDRKLERFKALVEPQLAALYRVARRFTGNHNDAEDLLQDACLSAWEKMPPGTDAAHAGPWLVRVLYHRFVDGTRRKRRSLPASDGDHDPTETLAATDVGPDELAAAAESERALDRAWCQLDEMQQTLLALRAEGFGIAEIEAITGIGCDALRARLHRARQSFARHLEDAERALEPPTRAGRLR